MKTKLTFIVSEQHLARDDNWKLIASESQNYLKAKFAFEKGPWVPGEATATFVSPYGIIAYADLDGNGECFVPNEVLVSPGDLEVSLFYSQVSDKTDFRISTNAVKIYIHPTLTTLHSGGES